MFAQGNFNALLTATGADPLPVLQITLPVGISFYIFQSLSYTIDVYRGDSPPCAPSPTSHASWRSSRS